MKAEVSIARQLELFQSLAFGISHITLANLIFLTSAARCFLFISSCLSVVGSLESLITPSKSLVILLSQLEVWAAAVLELRCPIRAHASPVPARLFLEHRTGQVWGFFSTEKSDHLRIALCFMLPCPTSTKGLCVILIGRDTDIKIRWLNGSLILKLMKYLKLSCILKG